MTGNAGEWCLMESDPGVFTELIKGFVTNVFDLVAFSAVLVACSLLWQKLGIESDLSKVMYKSGEGDGTPLQYSCLGNPDTEPHLLYLHL